MKRSLRTALTVAASLAVIAGARAADQHLYLAAGEKITVYSIDDSSGKLTVAQSIDLSGSGPFTFSNDGKRLYAMAADGESPQIATFDRKGDGGLALVDRAAINLRAGYLDVDRSGKFVAGNHYRPGKVTVWKLDDAGIYRGKTSHELELEPRAHSAVFSANNRWLLVPATGPNKVFVNRFDPKTGKLTPNDPAFGRGPQNEGEARHPRHLILHPKKPDVLYTSNESAGPGVCVWNWNPSAGTLEPIQNIVTRPEGFGGRMSTADLHLTPDAKLLYISNRNKDGNSSIAGFRVDVTTGRLKLIGHTPCETVPRSFCIDRTGKFIYVAGQIDNRLGVYLIDQKTGKLTKVEQLEVGKRPMWVEAR